MPEAEVVTCAVTCDSCGATETVTAGYGGIERAEALLKAHGWVRFGPSGTDLCHKCRGASPNTLVVVHKPGG